MDLLCQLDQERKNVNQGLVNDGDCVVMVLGVLHLEGPVQLYFRQPQLSQVRVSHQFRPVLVERELSIHLQPRIAKKI
jgi:hypothetical protein